MHLRLAFVSFAIVVLLGGLGAAISVHADPKTDEAKPVAAEDPHAPDANIAEVFELNGYSLAQFKDFQKKWHFVTARYRKDNGEMRLTYANDLAWKSLLARSTDYPDGAVFAKIGFMAEEDPSFTSSLVPSATRKYQLMVRNKKKHADTGGWGFAIFGRFGSVAEEHLKDPGTTGQICIACHAAVPEKGYVFSEPMQQAVEKRGERAWGATYISDAGMKEMAAKMKPIFSTQKAEELPANVLDLIPETYKEVRRMKHAALETKALGGIGEMRPMLVREAIMSKLPAALVNTEQDNIFAVAYIRTYEPGCKTPDGKDGMVVVTHFNGGEKRKAVPQVRTRSGKSLPISDITTTEFCQAQLYP
jgi:hypothetical protein